MRNMSLVCLVNSSNKKEYGNLQEILWSALDFFGMPYEKFDLAENHLSLESLRNHSAIVIAQEHLGKNLSEKDIKSIIDAVNEGVGLALFDGDIHQYKHPLKDALGLKTTDKPTHQESLYTDRIKVLYNNHFITSNKDLDFIRFNKPVKVGNIVNIEKEHRTLILSVDSSCPALITETCGNGKVVLFTLSPEIWLKEYFGHGGGLDDIFWKSIVWAARKPFVMLAMPPFVTIRIDDCSGVGDFEWVRILNKHGFIPHVSLFTENIGEREAKTIRQLYDNELAEFSVHAFTWIKQTYWKPKIPKYMYHTEGREYTKKELTEFFEKIDELRNKWGIKWSKVLVSHFGEVGKNAIPFLKNQDMIYLDSPIPFGVPYDKQPEKKLHGLKPYNGQGGVIDYHPDEPEFFITSPSYSGLPKSVVQTLNKKGISPGYDFLLVTDKADIEVFAQFAAFGIRFCLDNLFFGLLVTHEQNISIFNNEEWDKLLSRVDELTSNYEKIYKSWSYIAEYAKNLYNSRLTCVDYDTATGEVQCHLEGGSNMSLYLYVFRDGIKQVERNFKEVPSYKDKCTISFK